MDQTPFFQNLTRMWTTNSTPTAWPTNTLKAVYFDCPVAMAAHFQSFLGRCAQDQVQFLTDLSREQNPANILTREMAYLQQATLAWNTEMMELAELFQSKVLANTPLQNTNWNAFGGGNNAG